MHGGVHFFAESAPRKAMPKQYHFKSPGQTAWMEVDYLRENDVQRVAPRPSEYVPDDEPMSGSCTMRIDADTRRAAVESAMVSDVSHLGPEVAALVTTLRRLRSDFDSTSDRLATLLLEAKSCNPFASW